MLQQRRLTRLTAPHCHSRLTVFSFKCFYCVCFHYPDTKLWLRSTYLDPLWRPCYRYTTGSYGAAPEPHALLYPFQPQAPPPPLSQLASACTYAPCRSSRCSTALRSCDALLNLPSISLGGLTTPRRCRGSRAGPCRAAWPRPGRAPAPRPRGSAAGPSRCPRWRRAPAVGPARRGRPL